MSLGARIRAARDEAKLSQEALAKRLGRPAKAIARWEKGEYSPRVAELEEVARALGVTIESLISESETDPSAEPDPPADPDHFAGSKTESHANLEDEPLAPTGSDKAR